MRSEVRLNQRVWTRLATMQRRPRRRRQQQQQLGRQRQQQRGTKLVGHRQTASLEDAVEQVNAAMSAMQQPMQVWGHWGSGEVHSMGIWLMLVQVLVTAAITTLQQYVVRV